MRRTRPTMSAYSNAFLIFTPGAGPGSKLNTPLSVRKPSSEMSRKRMVVGANAAAASRVPGQAAARHPARCLQLSLRNWRIPNHGKESKHAVFRDAVITDRAAGPGGLARPVAVPASRGSHCAAAPFATLPDSGHDLSGALRRRLFAGPDDRRAGQADVCSARHLFNTGHG